MLESTKLFLFFSFLRERVSVCSSTCAGGTGGGEEGIGGRGEAEEDKENLKEAPPPAGSLRVGLDLKS